MQRSRIIAAIVVAAGLVAFFRRPVRPPESDGTWHPVDRQASHH